MYAVDIVILVVDAKEGIKQQTVEHAQIIDIFGQKKVIVAITKVNLVPTQVLDELRDQVLQQLSSIFKRSSIVALIYVDALTGHGIDKLKTKIIDVARSITKRPLSQYFRLAIDQVFHLRGYGTIVRGTIAEGKISVDDYLYIWPHEKLTRIRELYIHNQTCYSAIQGQRVALNLSNVTKEDIRRGDVLTAAIRFPLSDTIDLVLSVGKLRSIVRNREQIKLSHGTKELTGSIIFFDCSYINGEEEVICQIKLCAAHLFKRGDNVIVRRPSPTEIIGGGKVINPLGMKYKNSKDTIFYLNKLATASPAERILKIVSNSKIMEINQFEDYCLVDNELEHKQLDSLIHQGKILRQKNLLIDLNFYHEITMQLYNIVNSHLGIERNKCFALLKTKVPIEIFNSIISDPNTGIQVYNQYLVTEQRPMQIAKRFESRIYEVLDKLMVDGIKVSQWDTYLRNADIPDNYRSKITTILVSHKKIHQLMPHYYIHKDSFMGIMKMLYESTNKNGLILEDAKKIMCCSRKYLIPYLELLDKLGYTQRNSDKRIWIFNTN